MNSELDRVFEGLARVLGSLTFAAADSGNPRHYSPRRRGISIDVSIKVSDIDEFLASPQGIREKAGGEPLIDIIEDKKKVRVLVLLPGISKDDVQVLISGRKVRVEVIKGKDLYVKEIVCNSPPGMASVVAAVENNSVVELVFRKKDGRPRP